MDWVLCRASHAVLCIIKGSREQELQSLSCTGLSPTQSSVVAEDSCGSVIGRHSFQWYAYEYLEYVSVGSYPGTNFLKHKFIIAIKNAGFCKLQKTLHTYSVLIVSEVENVWRLLVFLGTLLKLLHLYVQWVSGFFLSRFSSSFSFADLERETHTDREAELTKDQTSKVHVCTILLSDSSRYCFAFDRIKLI